MTAKKVHEILSSMPDEDKMKFAIACAQSGYTAKQVVESVANITEILEKPIFENLQYLGYGRGGHDR